MSALVKEGVLIFQNGKYAVRQICTESLFSENPTEWALKQIGNARIGDEEKVILKLKEKKETAICIEDFLAIVNDTFQDRLRPDIPDIHLCSDILPREQHLPFAESSWMSYPNLQHAPLFAWVFDSPSS